jgi:hypothetical protein
MSRWSAAKFLAFAAARAAEGLPLGMSPIGDALRSKRVMEIATRRYAPDPRTVPPKPWTASLLSLAAPGLGHLYAGATRRAAGVWAAAVALTALAVRFAAPAAAGGGLLAGTPVLLYLLWATLDAARLAARHSPRALRRFNHWYVYLAIGALTNWATVAVLLRGLLS